MYKIFNIIIVIPILVFFSINSYAEVNRGEGLSTSEKIYGLSLIWSEVKANFAFKDKNVNFDFDKEYIDALESIISSDNIYEYYRELAKFAALLGDGHTKIMLPYDFYRNEMDWPDVYPYSIDNKVIVVGVGSKYISRLPLGSEITKINGVSVNKYISNYVFPFFSGSSFDDRWNISVKNVFFGLSNTNFSIGYISPDGKVNEITITSNSKLENDRINWIKLFKPKVGNVNFDLLSGGVAYLSINSFKDESVIEEFLSVLPKIRQSERLILDLRFNHGGNTEIVNEIVSYLTYKPLVGTSWKYRINNSVSKLGEVSNLKSWFYGNGKIVQQKSNHLKIPTAVLIGPDTGSAALELLVLVDSLDTFKTYGEKTNTSTGQAMVIELPGGGKALICIKRDIFPDGRELVGVGIQPDIPIKPTLSKILEGEDEVFERALLDLLKVTESIN